MRILVTGGAGFVGSAVVRYLLEADHSVVVLDDLRDGCAACVPPEVEFAVGDVADEGVLERLIPGIGRRRPLRGRAPRRRRPWATRGSCSRPTRRDRSPCCARWPPRGRPAGLDVVRGRVRRARRRAHRRGRDDVPAGAVRREQDDVRADDGLVRAPVRAAHGDAAALRRGGGVAGRDDRRGPRLPGPPDPQCSHGTRRGRLLDRRARRLSHARRDPDTRLRARARRRARGRARP